MNTTEQSRSLVDKGFELSKNIDKALVVGGIGAAAVGAVIAAPAVATFGALVAGGSVVGIEITKRIDAYRQEKRTKQSIKLGGKTTKDNFVVAA